MTYYLYIPAKKNDLSSNQLIAIKHWINLEKEKNNDVKIIYKNEKGLGHLAQDAKIYVWLPGKVDPSHGLGRRIPAKLARSFPSCSGHLTLKDKKNSKIIITDVAAEMIEKGLFDNFKDKNLRIKLFFPDMVLKDKTLPKAFFEVLVEDERNKCGNIRLDYYPDFHVSPPTKIRENGKAKEEIKAHKFFTDESNPHEYLGRASKIRESFYNKDNIKPKLEIEQVNALIKQYYAYKSSRFCGLSGALGLNGLFSSETSALTIQRLLGATSDEQRFDIALTFIKKHPDNYLSKCLKPIVQESHRQNNLLWTSKAEEPQADGLTI